MTTTPVPQEAHTEGPWIVATSNSWRRIVSLGHGGMQSVCEPITQNDGHPDLHFRNGGADGPDAHLLCAAPTLLAALIGARALLVHAGCPVDWLDAVVSKATGASS